MFTILLGSTHKEARTKKHAHSTGPMLAEKAKGFETRTAADNRFHQYMSGKKSIVTLLK